MITQQVLHNANKAAYIFSQYPEKTVAEVLALISLPAIDTNTAIWTAQDVGWLSQVSEKGEDRYIKVLSQPETWEFGDEVRDLEDMILYAFEHLARKKTDLEEVQVSVWCAGYPSHDLLIALKHLLNEKQLAEYTIETEGDEGPYIFYTLYENRDKQWGQNQFKKNPLEGKAAKGKKGK